MKNSFGAAAAADESQSKSKNNSPNESWRVLTRFSLFSLLYLLFLLFGCSFCCLEDMHKNALHFRFSWQRCCCCCCCCDFLFGCKLLLPVASGSIALRSVLSCAASESWFYALSKVSLHILRLLCPDNNNNNNNNCNSNYDYVKQSTAICCRAIAKLCSSAPQCHNTRPTVPPCLPSALSGFSPSRPAYFSCALGVCQCNCQTNRRWHRQTDRHLGIWNNLMFFIFIKFTLCQWKVNLRLNHTL